MGRLAEQADTIETLILAREWLYATYPDHVITMDEQTNYHIDPAPGVRSHPTDRVILTGVLQNGPAQWIQIRVLLPSERPWSDSLPASSHLRSARPYLSLPLSGRKTDLMGQMIQQRRDYEQYGHLALFSD